jgi:DNA-binding PadR family transcriptional regulator
MNKLSFDMKGYLSFRILCFLRNKTLTGQEIADLILKSTGKKPSSGTLYPALKELEKLGLIRMEKKGKQNFYSLASKGKKETATACKIFYKYFSDVIKDYK